jgi:hypothetical protein
MGDFEYLGEEEEPTGVGTDLFIRKNKPGPTVGVGYTIDVFENGIKIDTKQEKQKKNIKHIIDEKKDKYHTQRAFQNENQLHITYKTKEERGEFPPPEVKKPEEERKETAMENLDKELIRKANAINGLLQRLVDPTIPIKKRAEEMTDPLQQLETSSVSSPDATQPAQTADANIEKQIADGMFEKLIEFIKEEASSSPADEATGEATEEPIDFIPQTPMAATASFASKRDKIAEIQLDNIYNKVKSWVSKVIKKLNLFEKDNPDKKIDRDAVTNDVTQRIMALQPNDQGLTQEDIEVLQQAVQKPKGIPQKTQAKAEASGTEVSSPPVIGLEEAQPPAGAPTTASESAVVKTAMNITDMVEKLIGEVGTKNDGLVMFDVKDIVKDKIGEDPENLMQVQKALPQNFPGCALNRGITEMLTPKNDEPTITVVEVKASEFWDYAKNMNKTATLENAFEEWINKESVSLGQANDIWNKVSIDINRLFEDKTAQWMAGAEDYERTYFGKIADDIKELIKLNKLNYIPSTVKGILNVVWNYLAEEDKELMAKREYTIPMKIKNKHASIEFILKTMNDAINRNILNPLRQLAVGPASENIRGIMRSIIELPIRETIEKYIDTASATTKPEDIEQPQQQPAEQPMGQQPVAL